MPSQLWRNESASVTRGERRPAAPSAVCDFGGVSLLLYETIRGEWTSIISARVSQWWVSNDLPSITHSFGCWGPWKQRHLQKSISYYPMTKCMHRKGRPNSKGNEASAVYNNNNNNHKDPPPPFHPQSFIYSAACVCGVVCMCVVRKSKFSWI